jgi:hypothetical protein
MANTYTLIQSVAVGSGGAASIEFGSIPQTYTDLILVGSLRSTSTTSNTGNYDPLLYRFNGSTSGYTARSLYASGTSASTGSLTTLTSTNAGGTWGRISDSGVNNSFSTASTFSSMSFYIPNYADSNNKVFSHDFVQEQNQTVSYVEMDSALWSNTAAITSLALALLYGSFEQHSSVSLYGIKNS